MTLNKLAIAVLVLCLAIWCIQKFVPELGLTVTSVKGIVTANVRGCGNDLSCYLEISMPGKPETRVSYEEFWDHCAYTPSLAKLTPGALVHIRGRYLGYKNDPYFGSHDQMDICKSNVASKVTILPASQIADTELCSSSLKSASHSVSELCEKIGRNTASRADISNLFLEVGNLFSAGRSMLQDFYEAAKWYRMSAGYGNAEAASKLGHLYLDGHIKPWGDLKPRRQPIPAYEYLSVALKSRPAPEDEEARDQAASEIPPSQLQSIKGHGGNNWQIIFPQ